MAGRPLQFNVRRLKAPFAVPPNDDNAREVARCRSQFPSMGAEINWQVALCQGYFQPTIVPLIVCFVHVTLLWYMTCPVYRFPAGTVPPDVRSWPSMRAQPHVQDNSSRVRLFATSHMSLASCSVNTSCCAYSTCGWMKLR